MVPASPSLRARSLPLAATIAAAFAVLGAPLARAEPPTPVIGIDEIVPGQRGYGLSVFQGSAPERFDVEVLGVMHNVQPDTSYILARLSGQNLEQTGVVAGMSGSPVYIDGRLAGAVAFAWPFTNGAVGGITPISQMRTLLGPPSWMPAGDAVRRAGAPLAPAAEALGEIARADPPVERLATALRALAPSGPGGASIGVGWSTVGFGGATRALLAAELGPMAPSGEATGPAGELVPGSAVAGVLIDGDLRLAATGTVTDRVGDEVLAFGHPLLGVGSVALPMATAEVVTVLSNQFSSFKIAGHGPVVGAFEVDRMPGVRGRLGGTAPTIPMLVRVAGEQQRQFALRLAEIPALTPVLVAMGALGCLEASGQVAGPQGLDLDVRFRLAGGRELVLRQSFEGDQGPTQAAVYLLSLSGFLLLNEFEDVEIEAVELGLAQVPEPRTARLVGAYASQSSVRPGDTVRLNLDFVGHRSEPFHRVLEIELPSSLPAGRYSLLVGDGVSMDGARLGIERAAPVNFDQALDLLSSLHSRRELVVLGVFGEPGLAVAGEALPQLPGSMRSIWRAAGSGGVTPLRLAIAQEVVEEMDVPLAGAVRVDLEVERRRPLSSDAALGAEEADGAGQDGDAGAPAETGGGRSGKPVR